MFDRQKFQQIFQNQFPETALSLDHYAVLDSTNTTARKLVENNATLPLVVIADRQTAGRGQWGRQWQSDPGGLYLSLGMATDGKIGILLTFGSGWGIATALRQRGIPVQLKWPNDLILNGKKLGGIRTVTSYRVPVDAPPAPLFPAAYSPFPYAVIGVGINWENQPPDPGIALTECMSDRAAIPDLESLAALTTGGILSGYRHYLQEGADALLSSYWELAIAKERSVTVNGSPGTIVGITPRGELRIRLQSSGASTEIRCDPGAIALGYNIDEKIFSERSLHKKS
ncbi:MAG: biotin--[acetyl-CoA-carboxylase] ligase [Cyanobacteria bacterium P01_E01_bin.42]